jgi:hypothetical protein
MKAFGGEDQLKAQSSEKKQEPELLNPY